MSFLAGLGITSEKPPIVIEFGTRYTKAGFSGESGIVENHKTSLKNVKWIIFNDEKGPRVIVATPENLRNSSVEDIAGFFLWLYNVHLQISPRERRLTIVEKTSETEDFRAKIGHVALKFIAVPGNETKRSHIIYES